MKRWSVWWTKCSTASLSLNNVKVYKNSYTFLILSKESIWSGGKSRDDEPHSKNRAPKLAKLPLLLPLVLCENSFYTVCRIQSSVDVIDLNHELYRCSKKLDCKMCTNYRKLQISMMHFPSFSGHQVAFFCLINFMWEETNPDWPITIQNSTHNIIYCLVESAKRFQARMRS